MRYIDADSIVYSDFLLPHGDGNYEEVKIAYHNQIDDIPTADVRENVRGEWLSGDCMGASCSNCGEYFSFRCFSEVHDYNFCPNCGADMRQVTGKLKNSEDSTLSTR